MAYSALTLTAMPWRTGTERAGARDVEQGGDRGAVGQLDGGRPAAEPVFQHAEGENLHLDHAEKNTACWLDAEDRHSGPWSGAISVLRSRVSCRASSGQPRRAPGFAD